MLEPDVEPSCLVDSCCCEKILEVCRYRAKVGCLSRVQSREVGVRTRAYCFAATRERSRQVVHSD
jgi:hypothetical protein